MIVCVLIPRFGLLAALGDRRALLAEPVALAPEAGREQYVGEVSAKAEAFGVAAGMRVGEALSRCPELRLVPPDPEGVRGLWREVLERIESIGGEPESERAGAAYFAAGGLRGIHGGSLDGVLAATRRVLGRGARLGVATSRFAAWCAATQARQRRATVVVDRRETARFCARGRSSRSCRRRSSGSASAPSASSRRCRRRPSPSASGIPACWRSTSRAGATPR